MAPKTPGHCPSKSPFHRLAVRRAKAVTLASAGAETCSEDPAAAAAA
jgi:hypothetical protein